MSAEAYPLHWPDAWPRTPDLERRRSKFKAQHEVSTKNVFWCIEKMMGCSGVVLSTNLELRRDGLPYANAKCTDPGVAVYWFDGTDQRCMACDRWDRVRDNIHALFLSLEALRGLDRWGSSEIVARAFTGFTALPAPGNDWRAVFRTEDMARIDLETVRAVYKVLAMRAHPDQGGDPHEMVRLNEAMAAAKKELG